MADRINTIFNSQMANRDKSPRLRPKPELVDELANEIVVAFDNKNARRWYCGVIYKFGLDRVRGWFESSKEGHTPVALFAHYVNSAGGYHKGNH